MSSVLLLTALGHADPVAALADEAGQRKLVAWLEDTKIRALPLGEREQLRASDSPAWPASFAAYCQQLGCSLPPTPRAAVLDWLLCWAVGLEYRDGAARFTPSQSTLDSDQAKLEQLSLDEQTLTGVESAEFWAQLEAAAAALHVQQHSAGGEEGEAARVATALELAASASRLAWLAAVPPDERSRVAAAAAAAADAPGAFPLGFKLGDDPTLLRAATLLRARHVAALRQLQSRADAALVAAQEMTADPKTDARRGKVGR